MERYYNGNSVYIKKGTLENMILNYLEEHGSITNLTALKELGIMQCPARIWELKRRGVPIKTRPITVQNRFVESIRIVEYFKEEEKEKAQ